MAEFENPFADPEAQNLFHVSFVVVIMKSFLLHGPISKCHLYSAVFCYYCYYLLFV